VNVSMGEELATKVEGLLRTVQGTAPLDVDATLQDLTAVAVHSIPAAQHGGVTVATRSGDVRSASSVGKYPKMLDDIQRRHGDGPCLTAAWENHTVRIDDLGTETRWPNYCRDAVAETPVRSVMSFQLFADNQTMGALNFYAELPGAFDPDAVELGFVLATHVALGWNLVRRDQQFRSALSTRDVIGQAKGLIMERFGIDAVQSFDLLRRLSQQGNTPLVEVARELIAEHAREHAKSRSRT
jgi:transcriptional regulator with GAF, ATPase, and Fis domain